MEKQINYNVDDYGVLRVYRGNAILFEAQDFLDTPEKEIENFIDEYLAEDYYQNKYLPDFNKKSYGEPVCFEEFYDNEWKELNK